MNAILSNVFGNGRISMNIEGQGLNRYTKNTAGYKTLCLFMTLYGKDSLFWYLKGTTN